MSPMIRVPKYRHFKPRNLAVVRIEGRDFYLGPYGSPESKAKYKRLIGEWLVQRQQPREEKDEARSIAEIIMAYLTHADGYYRKDGSHTSEFGLIKDALRHLRHYETEPAEEFGPVALQVVRDGMINSGWCRNTINRAIKRIVRMFRWAASQQLISSTIPQALSTLEALKKGRTPCVAESEPVKPVSAQDVEATLRELSNIVADMVRIQLLTGCRPHEVCNMRPADIDRKKDVWVYTPLQHKTEHLFKERHVFIGPKARAILVPYLLRASDAYCFSPAEAIRRARAEGSEAYKKSQNQKNKSGSKRKPKRQAGERYSTRSYRRAINRACTRAKIAAWSPNQLRHAKATEIREKHGLEASQVVLGHATANTTQLYAERNMALAERIARDVG